MIALYIFVPAMLVLAALCLVSVASSLGRLADHHERWAPPLEAEPSGLQLGDFVTIRYVGLDGLAQVVKVESDGRIELELVESD